MKYKGEYMGVDKFIVVLLDNKQDDYTDIMGQFTLDTPISELKRYVKRIKFAFPRQVVKVFKETWQGKSWSDYENII